METKQTRLTDISDDITNIVQYKNQMILLFLSPYCHFFLQKGYIGDMLAIWANI